MRKILPYIIALLLFSYSCSNTKSDAISSTVSEYYKIYQKNKDFEKFMNFYDQEIELRDMINGDKIIGKESLRNFFSWNNPNLSRKDSLALVIEDQIIENNIAVTKGYFTPFSWQEEKIEAMHFTTILYFNESGKIVKQDDWINYPSNLVDYMNRKNSNDWIAKNKMK